MRTRHPGLVLDEPTHTYTLDGKVVPSVTQVLRILDRKHLNAIPREALEAKRLLGQVVHKCCELDDLGDINDLTVDAAAIPYLEAWRRFKRVTGFVVESTEQLVYHCSYNYAGTLDVTGWFDRMGGKKALIDRKTSDIIMPSYGPQTSMYHSALADPTIEERYIVQLKPDGKYELIPCNDARDQMVWVSALICWQHVEKFK